MCRGQTERRQTAAAVVAFGGVAHLVVCTRPADKAEPVNSRSQPMQTASARCRITTGSRCERICRVRDRAKRRSLCPHQRPDHLYQSRAALTLATNRSGVESPPRVYESDKRDEDAPIGQRFSSRRVAVGVSRALESSGRWRASRSERMASRWEGERSEGEKEAGRQN